MANKIVRIDVMSGNKDNSQVKSGMYFANDEKAAVENGTIVGIGKLMANERELYKVQDVTAADTLVGIISTPEVIYCECGVGDGDLSNFINEAGDPVRVHVLHEGDTFSIANVDSTEDIPAGKLLVAEWQQSEKVGRYTYQVYTVKAVSAE